MQWTPYGPKAVLIRFGSAGNPGATSGLARAITAALEKSSARALVDFTVAFDQVLVEFRDPEHLGECAQEVVDRLRELEPMDAAGAAVHEIPVIYDGEALAEVAAAHALSVAEVPDRHSAPEYAVAMLGFSPGFPYLTGLDPRLWTPRRVTPRARIRAGAVAIGGSHAGIYSVASAGGWNVIGHTTVRVFDRKRRGPDGGEDGMFLLRTGDRLRFVPVD